MNRFEPSEQQMRELIRTTENVLIDYMQNSQSKPLSNLEGAGELALSLKEDTFPEHAMSFESTLETLFGKASSRGLNHAHPGFMAFVPSRGTFHAALAEWIATCMNRYVGVWIGAPGLVQLETNVIRWFCNLVGYGKGSGGFLTTGGSLAILSAIITARKDKLPENFLSGTLYCSDQTHHAVEKGAMMAGFPLRNVRKIPSDEKFSIRLDDLKSAISQDKQDGLTPFLVVANAGTTNTGAIDDIRAISTVAKENNLWMHVDAAYGGFFLLTETGRQRLKGTELGDSIGLNPHKGLFLPLGTGALLVKDVETLRNAHASTADYMPDYQNDPEKVDYCAISPELSRDFRGLRVWLPLKIFGVGAYRECLQEKLDLTLWATEELRKIPDIEIVTEPQLTIVAFRLRKPDANINQINRKLIDRVNEKQRIFITGTMLNGEFALRLSILGHHTHKEHVQNAIDDIRASVQDLGVLPKHPTL